MLKGFRDFIMRGNVVDLAVGIVIGAAFGRVVDQLVTSFIKPLVLLVGGGEEVSGQWHLTSAVAMDWGGFVSVVITFLITAAAIYFAVVVPMNRLNELRRRGKEPEPEATSDEVRLLTEIRDALTQRRASEAPAQRTSPGAADGRP
jgi:large conductance mechanosensitive channel